MTTRKKDRFWLSVSAYLIECPKGKILVDTGWSRKMSPKGVYDRNAQIHHMSFPLYIVNQGEIAKGKAVDEQLHILGIEPEDLDYVLLTHLDCDHVSGVWQVREAKHILVSEDEMVCVKKDKIHSDGGYASKSWQQLLCSGIATDKEKQYKSLEWISIFVRN